jgi:hypothetical protein
LIKIDSGDSSFILSTYSGGINNFNRQDMIALLNCAVFGCTPVIRSLVTAGSDACGTGDSGYNFGTVASLLDEINNSVDNIELPFHSPSAQFKYCKQSLTRK